MTIPVNTSNTETTCTQEDDFWEVIRNVPCLHDNLYVKDHSLWIKTSGSSRVDTDVDVFDVTNLIKRASESLCQQKDEQRYIDFLRWICVLSTSFHRAPINLLKATLLTNKEIIYNALDILFMNVIQRGLLFIDKEQRPLYNSVNDKDWLTDLLKNAPFDKDRALTPELVKIFVNELITIVNIIISETTSPKTNDQPHVIKDYFDDDSFVMVLLYILFHLLATFVSAKSIHMRSMELSFHSKLPIKCTQNQAKKTKIYKSHNDQTQYFSANRWRLSKAAQITVQFHRLLIKLIWIIINDLNKSEKRNNEIFETNILKHPFQRIMLLQLMHFSVISYQCASDLLQFICHQIYKQKISDRDLTIVSNIGTALIVLCDEYQLEGNEFKVNMFNATLTTEEEGIITPEKKKEGNENDKELSCDPTSHHSNIVRFANMINSIYTFNVKQTILIILPLICQCVSVRNEVVQRKEVMEFLKELFFVILPQCDYLFIRFQYESQYALSDMIPILIKSRCGFNRENIAKFHENESKLVENCIAALHIFLYLGDIEGITPKTIVKHLNRTSKREFRNYLENMHRFIKRFGSDALTPIYKEFDFESRLFSYVEFSKPKKKRTRTELTELSLFDNIINVQFYEDFENGWIIKSDKKKGANNVICNQQNIDYPPFKKRKLNENILKNNEPNEWPIKSIKITLTKTKKNNKANNKKKRRNSYKIKKIEEENDIYPDYFHSPCRADTKIVDQWEPAVKAVQYDKSKIFISEDEKQQSEDAESLYFSSSADDLYEPPSNNKKRKNKKRRRSKRLEGKAPSKSSKSVSKSKRKKRRIQHSPDLEHPLSSFDISMDAKKSIEKYGELKNTAFKMKMNQSAQKVMKSLLSPPRKQKHPINPFGFHWRKDMDKIGQIRGEAAAQNKYMSPGPASSVSASEKSSSQPIISTTKIMAPAPPKPPPLPQKPPPISMNLPDINKSFHHYNNMNNVGNNININITNYAQRERRKKKKKRRKKVEIDLSKSDEENVFVIAKNKQDKYNNLLTHLLRGQQPISTTKVHNMSALNQQNALALQQMLLAATAAQQHQQQQQQLQQAMSAQAPVPHVTTAPPTPSAVQQQKSTIANTKFDNDDMFKINPFLDVKQMASHLYSRFEQPSMRRVAVNDVNKTLCRILLIAESMKGEVIRIECDDEEEDEEDLSHIHQSVVCAMKAIAICNNKYVKNQNYKQILFTAQMGKRRKVNLILDCFQLHANVVCFLKSCDNSNNVIDIDDNGWSVHNLAKRIIAHLNNTKYVILRPVNMKVDMRAVNVIVTSMIIAHTAIKTQFRDVEDYEAFWLYCLVEMNAPNVPTLGQTNEASQFANWTFKIVMNNNY